MDKGLYISWVNYFKILSLLRPYTAGGRMDGIGELDRVWKK
jgi:hypothetical protein